MNETRYVGLVVPLAEQVVLTDDHIYGDGLLVGAPACGYDRLAADFTD